MGLKDQGQGGIFGGVGRSADIVRQSAETSARAQSELARMEANGPRHADLKPTLWFQARNEFLGFGTTIRVKKAGGSRPAALRAKMPEELAFGRIIRATG